MPDVQIYSGKKVAAPSTYELPSAAEFILKCVNADFDGSGAAGDYLPCVTLVSDSGQVIARAVDQDVKVAAGSDAEVSWFPRVRRRRAAVTPSGPPCVLLGSGNGDTTLTVTLDTAVPAHGTLAMVFGQVTDNSTDVGSEPTAVVDSGGHGPWQLPNAPGSTPLIGNTRQTVATAPAFTMQVGSCVRECVGGDLGVGSTVTVTFGSANPGLFHSTGLLVYMPAYYVTVLQGNLATGFAGVKYNLNLGAPDSVATLDALSWDAYYGPPPWQYARRDAVMIAAMGSFPPVAGFAPYNGTVIGEITSGSVGLAAVCSTQCEGSEHDPGGTWPSVARGLVGNYQVAQPRTCSN